MQTRTRSGIWGRPASACLPPVFLLPRSLLLLNVPLHNAQQGTTRHKREREKGGSLHNCSVCARVCVVDIANPEKCPKKKSTRNKMLQKNAIKKGEKIEEELPKITEKYMRYIYIYMLYMYTHTGRVSVCCIGVCGMRRQCAPPVGGRSAGGGLPHCRLSWRRRRRRV